ncbi:MAG: glycosyltransferase family 4 protein [Cyanobacteria bacterium P01_A01_bin.123]
MRIAQIAPLQMLAHSQGHAGIETAVGVLTNALVHRGHQVTLFALEGSQILMNPAVVPPGRAFAQALQAVSSGEDYSVIEAIQGQQWDQIRNLADQFDLIHFHTVDPPFELAETLAVPTLYTLYGSFNPKIYQRCARYRTHNFISISEGQRQGGPDINYIRTVYSGVSLADYPFNPQISVLPEATASDQEIKPEPIVPPAPYLAFLGRMSPHQGPHLAIEVAKRSGMPLKLAGRIEESDRPFFDTEIAPHIDGHLIDYWGEVDHLGKQYLLSDACATLFPLTLDQPFGQVMVESMAVGTPVLTTPLGAATEVIVQGKTGFLCDSLDQMVEAVLKIEGLNRQDCRDLVARHFSVQRMVERYEAAYGKVLDDWQIRNCSAYSAAIAL